MIEAQNHRRFLKTHMPVDALNFSPKAKYIYFGRDGRDVAWSLYNHHKNANAAFYAALNETPGRVGPKITPPNTDVVGYFLDWLETDGKPFRSLWENMQSWWAIRGLENVLFVHYADLKRDLAGEALRIAAFLGLDPQNWPAILEHSSFAHMKANAAASAPLGGAFWDGGAETFINKGTNGRWQGELTAADVAADEARALAELGPDCAAWLAGGRGA
jgi:aryl sulfotransferase